MLRSKYSGLFLNFSRNFEKIIVIHVEKIKTRLHELKDKKEEHSLAGTVGAR